MSTPSLSDQSLTLGDFAETVTPETRELLLQRLATESHSESYQIAILGMAAETLNIPVDDLKSDLKNILKSQDVDTGKQFLDLGRAIVSESDFLILEITPRLLVLFPWLRKGDLVMITAPRGIGKSWIVHVLLTANTRGLSIGSWKTETPVHCLLVDGEMTSEDLQKRFRRLTKNLPKPRKRLDILSADLMHQRGFPAPNLANAEWRESLYKFLAGSDYGLIVIDNMAALSPGLDENSKQDWDPINQFFLSIRFLGIAVILIHHSGKDVKRTAQRGTSSHEDALDTSITLRQPPGYKQTDGCRFIVEFTKSRSVCGDGIRPFIFSIVDQEDGSVTWKTETKTFDPNAVISLLGNEVPQKEVVGILNIDPAIVSRIKTKAVADKLIEDGKKRGVSKFTAKGKSQLADYDISSLLSR